MKTLSLAIALLLISGCVKREPIQTETVSYSGEALTVSDSQEPIIQTLFRVVWRKETDSFSAKAIVHQQDPDLTSIAVFKGSRRILTIWKRESQVWVYLPREKKVYIGESGDPIILFPDWPELTVDAWLDLLWGKGKRIVMLEKNHYQFVDSNGGSLTWKQTKQNQRSSVQDIVFTPTYPEGTQVEPLEHLTMGRQ